MARQIEDRPLILLGKGRSLWVLQMHLLEERGFFGSLMCYYNCLVELFWEPNYKILLLRLIVGQGGIVHCRISKSPKYCAVSTRCYFCGKIGSIFHDPRSRPSAVPPVYRTKLDSLKRVLLS